MTLTSKESTVLTKIPLEDTPIYTQLMQEYAARDAYTEIFGPIPEEDHPAAVYVKTYALRGGGITVYGDPIGPRDS